MSAIYRPQTIFAVCAAHNSLTRRPSARKGQFHALKSFSPIPLILSLRADNRAVQGGCQRLGAVQHAGPPDGAWRGQAGHGLGRHLPQGAHGRLQDAPMRSVQRALRRIRGCGRTLGRLPGVVFCSENVQAGVRVHATAAGGGVEPAPVPCWGWPVAKEVAVPSMTCMVCPGCAMQARKVVRQSTSPMTAGHGASTMG